MHKTKQHSLSEILNFAQPNPGEQCWDIGMGEGFIAAVWSRLTGTPTLGTDIGDDVFMLSLYLHAFIN